MSDPTQTQKQLPLTERIRRAMYGDLSRSEAKRFMMLSVIFCFVVGTYWLLRVSKDALFMKITGKQYIPYAKMLSFMLIIPQIIIYSKLVDVIERHHVFYFISGLYGAVFFAVSIALKMPGIGLDNTVPSKDRLLGWVVYLSIESFGSLTVPAFWAFTNSITEQDKAKVGYGLIIFGGQFGAIGGPTVARYAKTLGMPALMFIGCLTTLMVPVCVRVFLYFYPRAVVVKEEKKDTGVWEGLRLIFRYKYLLGVFGVATMYEVIGTTLDYQLKFNLDGTFNSPHEVAEFMGQFGQWSNGLAFVFSFLGTGYFMTHYGLTFCLVAFPVSVGIVCVFVWASPSIYVLFYAMVVIKGLSYSLNNPCKEILYITCSKDIKFKAKGWIDMFGGRGAKSLGSVINSQLTTLAAQAAFGGPINFAIVALWTVIAYYTGKANQTYIERGIRLGETPHEQQDARLASV